MASFIVRYPYMVYEVDELWEGVSYVLDHLVSLLQNSQVEHGQPCRNTDALWGSMKGNGC